MAKDSEDKSKTEKAEEEPKRPLGWIILITIYLVMLGIILFWALIAFFPTTTVNDPAAPTYSKVGFMLWTFAVSSEMRLILLVIITGALGSLVHGFRSLFWYVGNSAFAKSWVLMYFLLPFIGSALSLIFYFVLRGGLFSPNATVDATSPFGFIGVAGLVGMFSNRAALKLQEIAESIFSTKESTKGKDNVDQETIAADKKTEEESKDKKKS
jgi:magnesium-transporting ATPase (P-type)